MTMLGTAELLSIADSLDVCGGYGHGLSPHDCISLARSIAAIANRIERVNELAELTVPATKETDNA